MRVRACALRGSCRVALPAEAATLACTHKCVYGYTSAEHAGRPQLLRLRAADSIIMAGAVKPSKRGSIPQTHMQEARGCTGFWAEYKTVPLCFLICSGAQVHPALVDRAVLRAAGRHHGACGTLSQHGPPCAACAVAGPGSHSGSALARLALTRCVNLSTIVSASSCSKSCWGGAAVVLSVPRYMSLALSDEAGSASAPKTRCMTCAAARKHSLDGFSQVCGQLFVAV